MQLQMMIQKIKGLPADCPYLDFVLIPQPITISIFAPLSSEDLFITIVGEACGVVMLHMSHDKTRT